MIEDYKEAFEKTRSAGIIAAGALDSEHIASGTGFQVGSNNIENNAVITSKIADAAVTGAKIENCAV